MRLYEVLLLITVLPLLTWCFYRRGRPAWALLACLPALSALVLHLGIEGYRLQLAPAYLATVLLFVAHAWPTVVLKFGPWIGALVFVCLLSSAVMGTMMPVFSFPTPTGPFLIGSTTRHLIDSTRAETQGNRPGEYRELMIKIWYPAAQTGTRDIYRAGRPLTLLNHHHRLVKLHSFSGVPLARSPARFPVVIVSPAWTAICGEYVYLAEELASNGFIVVGIDHPYGSHQTIFPDGRIVGSVLDHSLEYSSDEALESSLQAMEAQLAIRTADVRFTLDQLQRLDRHDPGGLLADRVDFSRVAVCGHSFGGAVAADTCLADARFKAGINFDGLIFGAATTRSIGKPFLIFSDDTTFPAPEELLSLPEQKRRYWQFLAKNGESVRQFTLGSGGIYLTLRGAQHMNFHDRVLYTPLKSRTGAGAIEPQRAMEITNAYVRAFLQTHVNGWRDPLLDAPSPRYPEVEFEPILKGVP